MKTQLIFAGLLLAALPACPSHAGEPKKVEYRSLILNLNDHRYDRVSYEAAYFQFYNQIPSFLEKSGITTGKYLALVIGSFHLPVAIKAEDEVKTVLLGLNAGDIVRVSGKVRPVTVKTYSSTASDYYLIADSIVPTGQSLTREQREESLYDRPGEAGKLLKPPGKPPGKDRGSKEN